MTFFLGMDRGLEVPFVTNIFVCDEACAVLPAASSLREESSSELSLSISMIYREPYVIYH